MGLDIVVGQLALAAREEDADHLAAIRETYDRLNAVLAEAGLEPHCEPLELDPEECFEAQMWGYGGLHAVRRLAAYHELRGRLPVGAERTTEASKDPVLESLYGDYDRHHLAPRRGPLGRLLFGERTTPMFKHLLWHSDCEGFYLPRPLADVVFDNEEPQREGLGGMVGSSAALLEECRRLAAAIDLPDDVDPEAEELWMRADSPPEMGPAWHVYGVEAFGLVRLIRGCERSLATGAALVFT